MEVNEKIIDYMGAANSRTRCRSNKNRLLASLSFRKRLILEKRHSSSIVIVPPST